MPDRLPPASDSDAMSAIPTQDKPVRKRLTAVPENPATGRPDPALLSPHQQALRTAVVDAFNAKKARKFVEKQVKHISMNRDLADGIKFLFDEHGRPPPNAPLEDIVDERRRIEYQIKWFEGILLELRSRLIRVKEVEDYALEMLSRAMPDD
jgi:hypothetical protein